MSQAMFTAASGMANAQTSINVVSNNIANMNTTAFKESSVRFSDVLYNVTSSGSPSNKTSGGVNPKEIGYGSQVSSITQKFTSGTFQSTGLSTDMMIQGNGFFTVLSPAEEILYTKAGDFSVDNQGFLVTSGGYKVMGTDVVFGNVAEKTPIQIPQIIHSEVTTNENSGSKKLTELNAISGITEGDFTISVTKADGTTQDVVCKIDNLNVTLDSVADMINKAVETAGLADTDLKAEVVDGLFTLTSAKALSFEHGSSNFLSETQLYSAERAADGTYTATTLDYKATITQSINNQIDLKASSYAFFETGAVEVTYSNGDKLTVVQDEGTNQLEFKYTTKGNIELYGSEVTVSKDVATPANLQMQLAHFMNPDGLEPQGNNLYGLGINNGYAYYGMADSNVFGTIKSGGLEASNVDLTQQFSDMIIAQRAIEANSRVFNAANQVMESLVYLGQ